MKYHENNEKFLYHEKYRREVDAKPGPLFQSSYCRVKKKYPNPTYSVFNFLSWLLSKHKGLVLFVVCRRLLKSTLYDITEYMEEEEEEEE